MDERLKAENAALRKLFEQEGWDILVRNTKAQIDAFREGFPFNVSTIEQLHYSRGLMAGLQSVMTLEQQLETYEENLTAEQQDDPVSLHLLLLPAQVRRVSSPGTTGPAILPGVLHASEAATIRTATRYPTGRRRRVVPYLRGQVGTKPQTTSANRRSPKARTRRVTAARDLMRSTTAPTADHLWEKPQ